MPGSCQFKGIGKLPKGRGWTEEKGFQKFRRPLNIGFKRKVCLDIPWTKPLKFVPRSGGIRVKHNIGAVGERRKARGLPPIDVKPEPHQLQVYDNPRMEEAAKLGCRTALIPRPN